MSEHGFIKLPRSLASNPAWYDARPAHQVVFLQILMRCCFKPTPHNFNGYIIELQPGQFAASLDQIKKLCGAHISIGDVRGCIRYFERCHFLTQHLTHRKTVLTVCQPEIYDMIKNGANTTSNKDLTQASHIKEEREERKEEDKAGSARRRAQARSPARRAAVVRFDRTQQDFVGLTPEVRKELAEAHPRVAVELQLDKMRSWLLSSRGAGRQGTRAFIEAWLRRASDEASTQHAQFEIPDASSYEDFELTEEQLRKRHGILYDELYPASREV